MVEIMDKKSKKKKILIYAGIIIVIYIVVPVMLFFFVDKFDVISSKINADNWLMFWATYLAGTLGGLATLAAMIFTVKSSYNQQRTAQKIREKEIADERKYQYSPSLSVQVMRKREASEESKIEEICRHVYLPETDVSSITADNTKKVQLNLEIKNIGFGPATNIFLFYDNSYIVNGVNSHSEKDFLLKECLNLGKEIRAICDLTLFFSTDLLEKNCGLEDALTVDILYQDILGNVIRKRVCFSLNNKYIYSESTPEYLSFKELKNDYPHIQDITRLFAKNEKTN